MHKLTVELENVQAIKHAFIDLGTGGITEFIGDNSNCKSALSRVIEYMTSGDLRDKETRESLINDNEDECRILFSKDKEILGLILRRNRNDSVVIYNPDVLIESNPEMVMRSIGDPGHEELLYKFGFRTYENGNICLQVCPTFGAIPFITTKGKSNKEIVDDITSDKVAEEFLDNYEKLTSVALRSRLKTLEKQKESLKTLIDACVIYDYEKFRELGMLLGEDLMNIGQYYPYQLDSIDVDIPPTDELIDIPKYTIPEFEIQTIYPLKSPIQSFNEVLTNLENLENHRCPTCLRRFDEHDTCNVQNQEGQNI